MDQAKALLAAKDEELSKLQDNCNKLQQEVRVCVVHIVGEDDSNEIAALTSSFSPSPTGTQVASLQSTVAEHKVSTGSNLRAFLRTGQDDCSMRTRCGEV
jgi:hypothetical protein